MVKTGTVNKKNETELHNTMLCYPAQCDRKQWSFIEYDPH